MRVAVPGSLGLSGRIALTVADSAWLDANRHDLPAVLAPPPGVIRDRREGGNVVCTGGLSAIAGALTWSGIQDRASALGITTATYLTPLWGAVGSGSGVPSAADTALFTELGRTTAGAGAPSPATPGTDALVTWLFYFPPPSSSWTVTEAGVFAGGTSSAASGTLLDHLVFPSPVTIASPDTVILQLSLSLAGS